MDRGPLASSRAPLLRRLELAPLDETRLRDGETETRVWNYGPFGSLDLYRLREGRGPLRGEAVVFVEDLKTLSERDRRKYVRSVEEHHRCDVQFPEGSDTGICRIPTDRRQWVALRDSLAASADALTGTHGGMGLDGGWLVVERKSGSRYRVYAHWAPFRASPGTPAGALWPVIGWLSSGQPDRAP